MQAVEPNLGIENLQARCERTLVEAARTRRLGSRQQVRAAARRFVKRHRRDASYLRWVLRSVAASSALAASLLGLGPAAQAAPTIFGAPGSGSPLQPSCLGSNERLAPAFADLDADGDLDLLIGEGFGAFLYCENTGDATSPAFTARTGAANPLDGVDLGRWSTAALVDFDGDADLDLLAGEYDGAVFYFENTGSAMSATVVQRTGSENPFDGVDVGNFSAPAVANLDADGEPDVVLADLSGSLRTFYVPEPAQGLSLGAGLTWLSGLVRLRRRRARAGEG